MHQRIITDFTWPNWEAKCCMCNAGLGECVGWMAGRGWMWWAIMLGPTANSMHSKLHFNWNMLEAKSFTHSCRKKNALPLGRSKTVRLGVLYARIWPWISSSSIWKFRNFPCPHNRPCSMLVSLSIRPIWIASPISMLQIGFRCRINRLAALAASGS